MSDTLLVLSTSLKLSPVNGRYALSLVGRNLTNSYYNLNTNDRTFAGPYEYVSWFARPREIVLQAEYHF